MLNMNKLRVMIKYINTEEDLNESIAEIKEIDGNVVLFIIDDTFCKKNTYFLETYLTRKQKSQCCKYKVLRDRNNYCSTHAIVNFVMYYLYKEYVKDEDIKFDNGKPFFESIGDKKVEIKFNISHSYSCAVIAFCKNEVGVDIEKYKNREFPKIIFEKYFAYINSKNKIKNSKFLYTLWTIKEATLKYYKSGIKNLEKIKILDIYDDISVVQNIVDKRLFYVKIIYLKDEFVIALCC